jgi:predicted DNA binding CopG/RHH family protein
VLVPSMKFSNSKIYIHLNTYANIRVSADAIGKIKALSEKTGMSQVTLIDEMIGPIYELAEKYGTINIEYETSSKDTKLTIKVSERHKKAPPVDKDA